MLSFFAELYWFDMIGLSVDKLLALFWNVGWADKNVDGVFAIIWFIDTLFALDPICPKLPNKLLFKFTDACGGGMLDVIVMDLFDVNCDGKLGDGVIDVVFKLDVRSLKIAWTNH